MLQAHINKKTECLETKMNQSIIRGGKGKDGVLLIKSLIYARI